MRRSLRGLSSDDACPPLAPSLPAVHNTRHQIVRYTHTLLPLLPLPSANPSHMVPLHILFPSPHMQAAPTPALTREELRIRADLPPSDLDLGRRLVERVGEECGVQVVRLLGL